MPPSATVAEIEARLRAGDESVTADEYLRADVDERFARLRAEAAAQAARDRAAAEHQERIAAFRASLPTRFDHTPIEKATARLAAAVDTFLDACRAHDDTMEAATEELRGIGPLPAGLAVDAPRYGWLTDGTVEYRPARPQQTVAGIVREAIAARYPRRTINLNSPPD